MDSERTDTAPDAPSRRFRRARVGTDVAIAARGRAVHGEPHHRDGGDVTGTRVLAIVEAEARWRREAQGELTRTRLWGTLSVLVGLVGVGIGLLSVASGTVKPLLPIAAAFIGVAAIATVAYASRASAHRWGFPGPSRKATPLPGGLAHVAEAMSEQRANARLGVARAVSSDG
jgi:hypothetical protein